MEREVTKGQVVAIAFIILMIILVAFLCFSFTKKKEVTEKVLNTDIKANDLKIVLNGNYVEYVNVNDNYEDLGASIIYKGEDLSDDLIVTYYSDGKQVYDIDTSLLNSYVIKYEIKLDGKVISASRVIIVSDNKGPSISVPEKKIITSQEALVFDVNEGVTVSDNSGEATVSCDNSLSILPGNYVITCKASDNLGNESIRKRLINVVSGISFKYDGKLHIKFPIKDNYEYKYSLDDGKTFNSASSNEIVDIKHGNVIAIIYENGNYVMSNTYYVR